MSEPLIPDPTPDPAPPQPETWPPPDEGTPPGPATIPDLYSPDEPDLPSHDPAPETNGR